MGRVTFQDNEVIRRINQSFVATWRNVHPGYRVEHLEGARFEEVKRIPSGQASENVVTLFCTPGGELLHVVPGHWKPKDYVKEIDFALSVAQAVAQAGANADARRNAVIERHRDRLARLDRDWQGGGLGRMVMENVHRRLMQEPLRPVTAVRGVEDYALEPATSTLAQKVQRLQQAIQQRQREGKDLRPVGELMQRFDELLQAGRLSEAEARVDRALGLLGEPFVPTDRALTPSKEPLSPAGLPESIRRKMQRAGELAERWKRNGRDLTPVAQVMNAVEPLLRQGRFQEAETVLDRGLSLLGGPLKSDSGKPEHPANAPPGSQLPPQKWAALDALRAEIEALRPARLVWRDIAWRTCLLDGLKEARAQKKPLLLWIFGGEPGGGRC